MPNLPPMLPGCMVVWQDAFDRFMFGLVVQFTEHDAYYDVLLVHDDRVKSLIFEHRQNNGRWRVLHCAR